MLLKLGLETDTTRIVASLLMSPDLILDSNHNLLDSLRLGTRVKIVEMINCPEPLVGSSGLGNLIRLQEHLKLALLINESDKSCNDCEQQKDHYDEEGSEVNGSLHSARTHKQSHYNGGLYKVRDFTDSLVIVSLGVEKTH